MTISLRDEDLGDSRIDSIDRKWETRTVMKSKRKKFDKNGHSS